MEIIVTDERDERFIKFCESFGCFLDDPQVVLLLNNYDKTVGCSSFKVYDADFCEITTLFLNSKNPNSPKIKEDNLTTLSKA